MTTLVSTASMTSADLIHDRFIKIFDACVLSLGVQATEYVFRPAPRERTRSSQKDSVAGLLDHKPLACAPILVVADRLRQDNLPFTRDGGRHPFCQRHDRGLGSVRLG